MLIQKRLSVEAPQDHIAIMKRGWGLTQKIMSGEKTIETRWYKNKTQPWDHIFVGDTVYFKDSGKQVTVRARVKKVEQFAELTSKKVLQLLTKFAKKPGLGFDEGSVNKFYHRFCDKRYCIVIYLERVEEVKPFSIDKTGYGAQSAWMVVGDVKTVATSELE